MPTKSRPRIGAVNEEVFNPIAQRLKRESPYKVTMMTTLTNGSSGRHNDADGPSPERLR